MIAVEKKLNTFGTLYRAKLSDLNRLRNEVELLSTDQQLIVKVNQALITISTRILGKSVDTFDKLVTGGLKAVFDDQNLEFKTRIDKARGKTAVYFELWENGKQAPLMDSYGGGVLVITGALLRIATIMTLDLKRLLILDESLSHLSIQYVPNASKLFNKLCKELDFTILMVTHEPEFASYADNHYEAVKGKDGTYFKLDNSLKKLL